MGTTQLYLILIVLVQLTLYPALNISLKEKYIGTSSCVSVRVCVCACQSVSVSVSVCMCVCV